MIVNFRKIVRKTDRKVLPGKNADKLQTQNRQNRLYKKKILKIQPKG